MRGSLVSRTWTSDPELYAPPTYRKACRYDAFLPEPVVDIQISLSGALASVISDAEAAVASLNARARPALRPFARLLLRTESIASSKVEGLQMNAKDLARAEARSEAGRRLGPRAEEILGNIDAMEMAIEQSRAVSELHPEQLVSIHEALMASKPAIAGRVRTVQNWIGGNDYNPCGADFVPPPPEEVRRLLADLCTFCNADDLPVVVQAAIAHAQFETIHPFEDGNGRTGRALIHILLRRRKLAPDYVPPISVILAAGRDRYIDGLTAFRNGDLAEWIEAFAVATTRSARLAEKYLAAVAALQDEWRDELRRGANPRADSAAWAIIDVLPGYPVVTVPVAVAATARGKVAVTMAVQQLEDAGVLEIVTSGRRNRGWEARGLLDLLADLENSVGSPTG